VTRHAPPLLFSSFQGWTPAYIGRDVLAGLTLAAITIPEQMATSKLGGFEPQIGFYAFIGATIGFAALGASRVMTVGADSTITPIFAGALAALVATGSTSLAAAAVALSLLVGVMLTAGGVLRLGWVTNLLSTPVTAGFLAGIAVHIAVSQLPSLFGIPKGAGDLPAQALAVATHLSALNLFSTAIGLAVLVIIVLAERISGRLPGALIGIVLATLAVLAFNLEGRGVAVLGVLPGGGPQLVLPALADLRQLLPLALIIALVVMMQTATVSHSFPDASEREPNVNRDLLGIGAGNLVAGLLGTFPVNASPPRTAVVMESGSASQLGALAAAAIVLVLVLWGSALLDHVPEAALAGVLLFIAQRIVRVSTIAKVVRQAPTEGLLILLTAAAVVVLPIQTGVAIGISLSLLHGVSMATHTRPVELLNVPGTTVWWPAGATEQGSKREGVLVVAFQAPLLFANAQTFKRGMIDTIDAYDTPPLLVVLEASGIADIDFTAAEALVEVIGHCRAAKIRFAVARLESVRARTALDCFGVLAELGPNYLFHSVDEAVKTHAPQA
jgi:MFS superfamily sulfate permease-like transporter